MPLRFLSRIKERGQAHFLFFAIIPQQRVGTGKLRILQLQKFGFRHSVSGDNFYSLGPIRKPPFLRGKWAKINPPVKNWVSCEKAGGLKPADLLWELENLAGNHSGIRSCGLLFFWASLGDPASFIPLNHNFRKLAQFSRHLWVRALPGWHLAASWVRCLPLPKEEFIEEETAFATHATHATQKSASLFLRDLRCVRDGRCVLHRHDLAAVHFPAGKSDP